MRRERDTRDGEGTRAVGKGHARRGRDMRGAPGEARAAGKTRAAHWGRDTHWVLRSGGLKVRLAQVDCVGEFKGKGSGRVFGNDQR